MSTDLQDGRQNPKPCGHGRNFCLECHGSKADPIQDIARHLGVLTFGEGLLAKIRQTIDLLRDAAYERDELRAELEWVKASKVSAIKYFVAGPNPFTCANCGHAVAYHKVGVCPEHFGIADSNRAIGAGK